MNQQTGETSGLTSLGTAPHAEEKLSIKGIVLQDGQPQAGVSIYALMDDVLQANTVSRYDGTYQFDALPMHDSAY